MTGEIVEYRPLIPFTDDPSPSFVNGFEAGIIFSSLKEGGHIKDMNVHPANKGLIELMCRNFKKRAEFHPALVEGEVVDGWLVFSTKPMISLIKT